MIKSHVGLSIRALARSICCRARKTVRSPALISADTVHSRNATLIGSMRSVDQKVSSPIRCCLAWQAAHKGTAKRSPGFTPTPPSVPVRTCAASDGAALPQAMQGSWRTKARWCTRRRKSGLDLRGVRERWIRGAGIAKSRLREPEKSAFCTLVNPRSGHSKACQFATSRYSLQTGSQRRLQRQAPRDRHLGRGADLFHYALDKVVEDLQLAVERLDERLIGLNPHDQLWQHVMPADDIDPAALRDVELALQLRPEALMDGAGNPVFDLRVRQRGLDFQQAVVTDQPVGAASDRVIVVGDEADPLHGHVLVEFIPIDRIGFDYQAPLHCRRVVKLDLLLQQPLGDQHAGVFAPLLRRVALRCDDFVEIGAGRDPELEAVIGVRVLRHIMKDGHDRPRPWRSAPRA